MRGKRTKEQKWIDDYIGLIGICLIILICLITKNSSFSYNLEYNKKQIVIAIIFIISIIIGDNFPIVVHSTKKSNQVEITISLPITLTVAFALYPLYSILSIFIGTFISEVFIRKNEPNRWNKIMFNSLYLSLVTGITSVFFNYFYNFKLNFLSFYNVLVLILGGLIYFFVETLILFGLLSHLNHVKLHMYIIKNIKATKLEILTLFPLGYLLMYLYIKNFWVSVLLIPLFIAIYLASKEKVKIIEQTEKTLFTLAQIEDDKFPDTKKHSDRVGNLVKELTSVLKLSEDDADIIIKAAKLHDIGKIAIPDKILEKPGRLTKEEWEIIKTHPEKGAQIVKELSSFEKGTNIILHHHERWDGKGYPDKLKGEEIPLGSRIISLADSFDAMISYRIYRDKNSKKKRKTIKEALKEINNNSGTQFDPKISKLFCETIEELVAKLKSQKVELNKKFHWADYFPEDAREE